MKSFLVLLFFILPVIAVYARTDTAGYCVRTGVSVNAGELIDVYQEPNCRMMLERRLHNTRYAWYIAPGIYFSGTGFNAALGFKKYSTRKDLNRGEYMGLELFYKYHDYVYHTIGYSDSLPATEHSVQWPIVKQVWSACFTWGTTGAIRHSGHFYFDAYWGLGLRLKYIEGLSQKDYHNIELWIDHFTQVPPWMLYPTIKLGVNVGYNFRKKM